MKWGSIYHRYKKKLLENEDVITIITKNSKDLTTLSEFYDAQTVIEIDNIQDLESVIKIVREL